MRLQSPLPPPEPTPPSPASFPIVGIGASAGGLAAFSAFFSGLLEWFLQLPEPASGQVYAITTTERASGIEN